jgi:hypothetical protein
MRAKTGLLFVFGLAAALAGCTGRSLYLDNGTGVPVTVTVDGKDPVEVPPFSFTKVKLAKGQHHVEGKAGAETVESVDFEAGGKDWVVNLGGHNRYAVHTALYGVGMEPRPRAVQGSGHAFPVPDEAGGVFTTFPGSVKMKKGQLSATLRRLWHAPLHEGRPCCNPIVAAERAAAKKR